MKDGRAEAVAEFYALHAASRRSRPPGLHERTVALSALRSCLVEAEREFAAAIAQDFGSRSVNETLFAEVLPSLGQIDHALRHLKAWMRPRRQLTALHFLPGSTHVEYQPKGVVLVISPWNYPLYLSFGPLVSAIAAGNRVVLKPSEATPATSAVLKRRLEAALGSDLIAVANGGAEVARELCTLPFDHILFTGSTAAGREVMRAAAENLTPVTLELGGKSPAIVHASFDIALAARRIARGKLLNAGQTCIAPDFVMVPESKTREFVACYRAAVLAMYPRLVNNPDYAAIINNRQLERLRGLLEDARAKGADVMVIGKEPSSEDMRVPEHRRMAPTILTNVREDMAIIQEEIFGPLLPVVTYQDLDEAIAYVNARPRPLALYYFDVERSRVRNVLARTVSGGVTINDTLLHIAQDGLPFGGIGSSGMGAYHGAAGFRAFSHEKAVFHQARWAGSDLLAPPYGPNFARITAYLKWRFGASSRR